MSDLINKALRGVLSRGTNIHARSEMQANERVLGCLLGGMTGDAAGATLEFIRRPLSDADVRRALDMPGGGALGVGAGQVTDDSELMLALAGALTKDGAAAAAGEDYELPVDDIALAYSAWNKSDPFDCGMTCALAFGGAENARDMANNARTYNRASESNGALMRCAPLACIAWANNLSVEKTAAIARQDAQLSHPSSVCQDANAAFCVALAHLLRRPQDNAGAVTAARSVVKDACVASWLEFSRVLAPSAAAADFSVYARDCCQNVGHVKHAFVLAFSLLRARPPPPYQLALASVLKLGGDTDTNACICGYLMGALYGFRVGSGIPPHMRDAVLKFDCTSVRHTPSMLLGTSRPQTYRSTNVLSLAAVFCHIAAKNSAADDADM